MIQKEHLLDKVWIFLIMLNRKIFHQQEVNLEKIVEYRLEEIIKYFIRLYLNSMGD